MKLSARQSKRVLQVLEAEHEASRASWHERWLHRLFLLAAYAFFGLLLLALLVHTLVDLEILKGWRDSLSRVESWLGISYQVASALAVLLLFLNLPLLERIWRYLRLARHLGLSLLLEVWWLSAERPKGYSLIWGAVPVGALFLLVGLGALIARGFGAAVPVTVSPTLIAVGVVFLAMPFIHRSKLRYEALAEVVRLQEALAERVASQGEVPDEGFTVSAEETLSLQRIEEARTLRLRYEAIASSLSPGGLHGYSLRKSRAALGQQADLPPAAKLQIEEALETLMLDPEPADARQDKLGVWHLSLPAAGLELRYLVDQERRQVSVLELCPLEGIENSQLRV